jgi:asparagine synthase (glutamine-hydrolysing)
MCGIAGFLDLTRSTSDEDLRRFGEAAAGALSHRGPDQQGVWTEAEGGVVLGFRRLAIVDLSQAGDQPMVSDDGRYVITYNGEIYNHRELRADLPGVRFRGHSDTEVMLEQFAQHGIEATLPRLIGMFAIVLWDRADRRLWLIRDRLGVKPMYWARQGSNVFWGSELKALRAQPRFRAEVDREAVADFLRFLAVPGPATIYRNVRNLEPGTWLRIEADGSTDTGRYWDMAEVVARPKQALSDEEAIHRCEALLQDSVSRRMVADVPLGALLSGGVDSSAVVAMMQRAASGPVRTFTIGFEAGDYDEAEHALAVARHLGTEHTELRLSPEAALELIPSLPDFYDEPFADSSALPTALVSRMARQSVTVALSGDGGDEVFLGYNRHRLLGRLARRLDAVPLTARRLATGLLRSMGAARWDRVSRHFPASLRPAMPGDKAHKLAALLSADGDEGRYLALVSHWAGLPAGVSRLPERTPALAADPAASAAYWDTLGYLPNDVLTKVDRASMAFGLEAREPLLDHRLVEFAWTLRTDQKVRDGQGKWLLRQILYRHVPRDLVDRPKRGFAVPLADWLRGPLRDWASDLLDPARLKRRGLVDPAVVNRAWAEHRRGKGNRAEDIWAVLMLEAWADRWLGPA